jgi:hypothetical protein
MLPRSSGPLRTLAPCTDTFAQCTGRHGVSYNLMRHKNILVVCDRAVAHIIGSAGALSNFSRCAVYTYGHSLMPISLAAARIHFRQVLPRHSSTLSRLGSVYDTTGMIPSTEHKSWPVVSRSSVPAWCGPVCLGASEHRTRMLYVATAPQNVFVTS